MQCFSLHHGFWLPRFPQTQYGLRVLVSHRIIRQSNCDLNSVNDGFSEDLLMVQGLSYQTNSQYECYTPRPFLYLPSFACPCVRLISILLLPQTATRRETKGTSVLCTLWRLKPLYIVRSGFMYDVGVRGEVGSSIYAYKHIQ